jgi:alpha-ketoglutarate-dependent taurine dioxygenase
VSPALPSRTQRRALPLAGGPLVDERVLDSAHDLPLQVVPRARGVDLAGWATERRGELEAKLLQHGAILFRDFPHDGPAWFERVIAALSSGALEYQFRASPRTRVAGNVYTSTDYPADQMIFPHNEHAYSPRFPLRLFFYCEVAAERGGATPVGSNREILRRIPEPVVERFRERGVLYVRNYGDGFGLPWTTVFQTDDRSEVERYCDSVGIEVEWKDGNRLRTQQRGPALLRHPQTGEDVWFNHGTFFHVSTLPPAMREPLLATFGARDLPTQTFYGDGAPIEPEVLDVLRGAYRASLVSFPWQRGDVLMLDNMLAVHGREPYEGKRSILAGMADPYLANDLRGDARA